MNPEKVHPIFFHKQRIDEYSEGNDLNCEKNKKTQIIFEIV